MKRLPQLIARGETLPEAWEKSLFLLKKHGEPSKKESYTNISGVDEILEASMKIIVKEPFKEPMIHKGCDGLMELEEYVQEVLDGSKDDYIGKGWDYTYHQRLFEYETTPNIKINQIESAVNKLSERSFSNRAQAVTWIPNKDPETMGPPCLQRVWCKVFNDQYLELHTSWRSRDAYNAAFMNMYAMINLQRSIADKLNLKVGQYVDDSDSYHVYDRNFTQLDKFIETILHLRTIGKSPWTESSTLKIFKHKSQAQLEEGD